MPEREADLQNFIKEIFRKTPKIRQAKTVAKDGSMTEQDFLREVVFGLPANNPNNDTGSAAGSGTKRVVTAAAVAANPALAPVLAYMPAAPDRAQLSQGAVKKITPDKRDDAFKGQKRKGAKETAEESAEGYTSAVLQDHLRYLGPRGPFGYPTDAGPVLEGAAFNSPAVQGLPPMGKIPNALRPIPELSRNAAVYEGLSQKHTAQKGFRYNDNALNLVNGIKEDIKKAAQACGVPPEAVAAAMLDENTSHNEKWGLGGVVDGTQDTMASWSPTSNLSYQGMKKLFTEHADPVAQERSIWDSQTWDIGPFNVNAAYGFELFRKHVAAKEADGPLKKITLQGLPETASDAEKWESFKERCLFDAKGGAYVTAEVLREAQRQLAPHMKNSTPEEKAALLVTYFKQGGKTMRENYNKRVAREGKSDMRPGEGAALLHNMEAIRKILP